jgi:hypothetical protein
MFGAFLRWTFLVGAVALFVGCSGGGTVPVTGKVTLTDGTPVTAGHVEFSTEDMKMSSSGEIGEDGTYTLSTYGQDDGCPPGKYRVMVSNSDPPVATVYEQQDSTPLTIEVTADKTDYPLKLEKGSDD